ITTAAQPYYCTVLPVTPCLLLLSSAPPPPSPTLFPYTTLFRSRTGAADDRAARDAGAEIDVSWRGASGNVADRGEGNQRRRFARSEEHTSELQSRGHLVCRLLLEKKKQRYSVCSTLPSKLRITR